MPVERPIRIELSWPVPALSPNARGSHWPATNAKKTAKKEAYWATRAAMGVARGPSFTRLPHDGTSDVILTQTAYPPANYRYDRDGIDARLKAHRDGIAKALGVDDRFFRPTGIVWGDSVPNGRIVIEVSA